MRINGRHRLGSPGLVHCVSHPQITAALRGVHRGWLWALLIPARHSVARLRRRAVAMTAQVSAVRT